MVASLNSLPSEILLMIGEHIMEAIRREEDALRPLFPELHVLWPYWNRQPDSLSKNGASARRDLWSFAKTSRRLYHAFFPYVYKFAASISPIPWMWGASAGCLTTMERAIATGTMIDCFLHVSVLRNRLKRHEPKYNFLAYLGMTDDFHGRRLQNNVPWLTTALHLACANNQRDAVEWLLHHGASLKATLLKASLKSAGDGEPGHNKFDRECYTWYPLGVAVWYGSMKALKVLLSHGASLYECHADFSTLTPLNALHIAAGRGHLHLFQFLTQYTGQESSIPGTVAPSVGSMMEKFGQSVLEYAVKRPGNGAIISELARHGIRGSFRSDYPPFGRAGSKHAALDCVFNSDCDGRVDNILHILQVGAHESLSKGAYVSILRYCFHPPTRFLPGPGSLELNQTKEWEYSVRDCRKIIEHIFSAGHVGINEEICPGHTALMMAASDGGILSAKLVEFLLDLSGCDPENRRESPSKTGTTALHLAVSRWLRHNIKCQGHPEFYSGVMDEILAIILVFLRRPSARITTRSSQKYNILLKNDKGKTVFRLIYDDIVKATLNPVLMEVATTPYSRQGQRMLLAGAKDAIELYSRMLDLALENGLVTEAEGKELRGVACKLREGLNQCEQDFHEACANDAGEGQCSPSEVKR